MEQAFTIHVSLFIVHISWYGVSDLSGVLRVLSLLHVFHSCPIMATLPSKPRSDNVSCHRVLIYLRALFMDTFTSTDHRAHTTVLQTTVASPRITARLWQQCSPPTSLHGKGHAGLMTCYLKRTWWILKAGRAQSNYTPGRHGAFAELCLSDILFLFGHLYYVRLCSDSTDVLRFKLLLLHPGLPNR